MITSKKLKGILKLLVEHRVRFYKDEEVEIEMRSQHDSMFPNEKPIEELVPPLGDGDEFNIDKYDKKMEAPNASNSDDLGLTEDDYLYWSADN